MTDTSLAKTDKPSPVLNQAQLMLLNATRELVGNVTSTRAQFMNQLIDSRRSINDECGYPDYLTIENYKTLYDREGVATRVVQLYPHESWKQDPEIQENDSPDETDFEKAVKDLDRRLNIWAALGKADEVSGIGRFGVILLGFSDGGELDQPVPGINERGEIGEGGQELQLLYHRCFDESQVDIKATETDKSNPRFGRPTMYSVSFADETTSRTTSGVVTEKTTTKETPVHWTRVIHVADNKQTSINFGVPRMQTLFNRLYDLRKIMGGSGEMFWKGAFPGYSFEMDSNAKPLTTTQKDELTEELANWMNGLQRYLTTQGITVNSLTPQVGDPKDHVDKQFEYIAISMDVPKRIFMGSEQAKLASEQDTRAWNTRIRRRRTKYLTPDLIRPLIDRLIAVGALPTPKQYDVVWSDFETLTELQKAEVVAKLTDALAKYVAGNVDALIPEEEFLSMFVGLEMSEIKQIMEAALRREKAIAAEVVDEEEDDIEDETGDEE